jgi:hypothetical protein
MREILGNISGKIVDHFTVNVQKILQLAVDVKIFREC